MGYHQHWLPNLKTITARALDDYPTINVSNSSTGTNGGWNTASQFIFVKMQTHQARHLPNLGWNTATQCIIVKIQTSQVLQ
jgi:hypothetical protein